VRIPHLPSTIIRAAGPLYVVETIVGVSRCLLADIIILLPLLFGASIDGIVNSSGCYLGPDGKWYAEKDGMN